jgi:peptide/nickel transport system ATP-binding protein/oligopeptide transport system ATP-binding protein
MRTDPSQTDESQVLLKAVALSKRHTRGRWLSRSRSSIEALSAVDLKIPAGSTLALVGPSGSGKSTLGRCLACLEKPDSGEIWFAGRNLVSLTQRELIPFRRQIQLVFQEPSASLNPRFRAVEIVSEPLLIAGRGTKKERREHAIDLMALVGLPATLADRSPFELSGGQRRRLVIARALALEPKLLILDEALAGLDLSTRAQISNLLLELQEVCSLTYLFISHDEDLVAHFADEVALLHEGRIAKSSSPELPVRSQAARADKPLTVTVALSGLPG